MSQTDLKQFIQDRLINWLDKDFSKKIGIKQIDQTMVYIGTTRGRVREENQDRIVFIRARFKNPRHRSFAAAILCDGIAGMKDGKTCADIALCTFVTSLIYYRDYDLLKRIENAVRQSNEAVYNNYLGKGGTTLSAYVLDDTGKHASINAGDSRIYTIAKKGEFEQISVDDTIHGQLNVINRNQAGNIPEFNHLIQYIGMGDHFEPRKINMRAKSEIDKIIITSDGIHSIGDKILSSIISNEKESSDFVKRLISLSEWMGGYDNASVGYIPLNYSFDLHRKEDASTGIIEIWSPFSKIELFDPFTLREITHQEVLQELDTQKKEKEIVPSGKKRKRRKAVKNKDSTSNEQESNQHKQKENGRKKEKQQIHIEFLDNEKTNSEN